MTPRPKNAIFFADSIYIKSHFLNFARSDKIAFKLISEITKIESTIPVNGFFISYLVYIYSHILLSKINVHFTRSNSKRNFLPRGSQAAITACCKIALPIKTFLFFRYGICGLLLHFNRYFLLIHRKLFIYQCEI